MRDPATEPAWLDAYVVRINMIRPSVISRIPCAESWIQQGGLVHHSEWGQRVPSGPEEPTCWTPFQEACVRAGAIISLAFVLRTRQIDSKIAVYRVAQALIRLARTASVDQSQQLLHRVRSHGLLDVCLEVCNIPIKLYTFLTVSYIYFNDHYQIARNQARVWLHRFGAVNLIRSLAADLAIGATLCSAEIADTLCTLCDICLENSDEMSREMGEPQHAWQFQFMQALPVEVSRIKNLPTSS